MKQLIPINKMTIEQQQELSEIMGCNWVDVFCNLEDFAFEWSVGGSVESETFRLPLSRILKAIQFFEENQIDYKRRKLFRPHRGSLEDSLNEIEEVSSLKDIREKIDSYFKNVRIQEEYIDDSQRLGLAWKETHYVVADFNGFTGQCIGYTNFYE